MTCRPVIVLILIALFGLISPSTAFTTDYYVSSSQGSDQNGGLTILEPWRTLSKVGSSILKPGDRILLKKGDSWRERLVIPSSGSQDAFIEVQAYGSGSAPIINGSMVLSGWTENGGIYQVSYSGACNALLEDARPLLKASSSNLLDGNWYNDGVRIYYKPTSDRASDHLTECSYREGITLIAKSYISIAGITVYASGGIYIVNSTHLRISNCDIRANSGFGIGIKNDSSKTGPPCADIIVEKNTVAWNANGIYLIAENGAQGHQNIRILSNLIEYNDFNQLWHHSTKDGHAIGIQNTSGSYFAGNELRYNHTGVVLWTASDRRSDSNVFSRNYIHDNEGAGMVHGGEGQDNSIGNIWAFNIVSGNGWTEGLDGGFRINRRQSGMNYFMNNILANNDVNLYLYSLTDYAVIKKNISYRPTFYHVLVEGGLQANVLDENLYYPDGEKLFGVASARHLAFTAWQSKTGQEGTSLVGDPSFTDPSLAKAEHFRPAANSPAYTAASAKLATPQRFRVSEGSSTAQVSATSTSSVNVDYFGQVVTKPFIGAIAPPQ